MILPGAPVMIDSAIDLSPLDSKVVKPHMLLRKRDFQALPVAKCRIANDIINILIIQEYSNFRSP